MSYEYGKPIGKTTHADNVGIWQQRPRQSFDRRTPADARSRETRRDDVAEGSAPVGRRPQERRPWPSPNGQGNEAGPKESGTNNDQGEYLVDTPVMPTFSFGRLLFDRVTHVHGDDKVGLNVCSWCAMHQAKAQQASLQQQPEAQAVYQPAPEATALESDYRNIVPEAEPKHRLLGFVNRIRDLVEPPSESEPIVAGGPEHAQTLFTKDGVIQHSRRWTQEPAAEQEEHIPEVPREGSQPLPQWLVEMEERLQQRGR